MATYNLKRKTFSSGQEYYEEEEPQENLYSVLMSEDEIRLFSEYLEEREYGLGSFLGKLRAKTENTGNAVKNGVVNAYDATKKGVKGAYDSTVSGIKKVGQGARDQAIYAGLAMDDLGRKVKTGVGNAVTAAQLYGEDALNKISSGAKKTAQATVGAGVLAGKGIKKGALSLGRWGKRSAKEIAGRANNFASNVKANVGDYINTQKNAYNAAYAMSKK